MATNGPWLEVEVNGCTSGDRLDLPEPATCTATLRVVADRACTIRLFRGTQIAWERRLAEGEASAGWAGSIPLELGRSEAIMAEVRGDADDLSFGFPAYAHTSPVLILVEGQPIARAEDVLWCIEWLDRLRAFIALHGRGVHEHLDEVNAIIDAAAMRLRNGPTS